LSTSPTIRAATPEDVRAIAALLTELNIAEGNPRVMDDKHLAEGLFGQDKPVPLRAMVALLAGEIVGVGIYYTGYDVLTTSPGYHLTDLVVSAKHRRQGIGKLLYAHLAAENIYEGGEWMSLTVVQQNAAARAFYCSLGMAHMPVDFFAIGLNTLTSLSRLLQK